MMAQHLTSMFEQIGNFTKNNLTHNSKLMKEKENKSNANHVGGEKQQASPSHKHGHAQPPPPLKKPYKLRNVCSKAESYDTLYSNSIMKMSNLTIFDPQEINDIIDIDCHPIQDLFYNTQNLEDLCRIQQQENIVPDDKKKETLKNKTKKKLPKKSQVEISNNLSYVSRKRKENGHHLIKITIYELVPGVKCRNDDKNVCLSAQYVVEDKYDEILDSTESVVSKIVKKISDSDSFRM